MNVVRVVVLVALVVTVACEQDRGPPVPISVDPPVVSSMSTTAAIVHGSNFLDFARVDLEGSSRPVVDRTWTVTIGDTPALDVARETVDRIRMTVPSGLTLGTHDVTVTAPDGQSGTLVDGLLVSDEPQTLSIETAPDGTGEAAGDRTLNIGESFEVHAVVRAGSAFVRPSEATWSVGPIGSVTAGPASSTRFDARMAGSGRITANDPALGDAMSGTITVLGDEPMTRVRIDDAPGGAGVEVGDRVLFVGDPLVLHAVEVDAMGEFVSDLPVTWSVSGPIGTLDPGPSTATSLDLTTAGDGVVTATASLGTDATGNIMVNEREVEVVLISDDPAGDGSRRASVFGYADMLAVGPSDDGTGTMLMDPDGASPIRHDFAFLRDPGAGSTSRNGSADPYPSIGVSGCIEDTPACGPDNENGRGIFRSASIRGIEWMIHGGARDGDLEYIYMTNAVASLDFRFVDLSQELDGGVRALTAMHAFQNTLYLGFAHDAGERPYLVRLEATPDVDPGLDVDEEAVDLEADDLPNIVSGDPSMIDVIWDFANRVYVANSGAWHRSRVTRPAPANSDPGDWVEITPTSPLFTAKSSFYSDLLADFESADRAVPFMATFKGRLYVARNTTVGPQLWACDPLLTASATHCDAGDFFLVAPNTGGDTGLTSFDSLNNTSITLLAATADHLYVGYDNAIDGVVLFRTDLAAPSTQADFEGQMGCSAADHPAACAGLGGNGFGVSTNDVIFDARVITFPTGEAVYLTVGDGVVPVRAYRMEP